jgi:hypothetical protein
MTFEGQDVCARMHVHLILGFGNRFVDTAHALVAFNYGYMHCIRSILGFLGCTFGAKRGPRKAVFEHFEDVAVWGRLNEMCRACRACFCCSICVEKVWERHMSWR